MDPASAIGVASGAVTFAEFTYKFLSTLHSIRDAGRSLEYDELELVTNRMRDLSLDMLRELPTSNQSQSDVALANLASQCHMLSTDLLERLGRNKAESRKIGDLVKATLRSMCSKAEIERLQKNLETCRAQIHLHYAVSRRYIASYPLHARAHQLTFKTQH
jgi:hypothetical protein